MKRTMAIFAYLFLSVILSGILGGPVQRRHSFPDDAPRRHFEELIASRRIRSGHEPEESEEEAVVAKATKQKFPGFLRSHFAPPTQTVVSANENLELRCDVSGSPPPAIYWLKNGEAIAESPFDIEETTNKIIESDLIPSKGLASTSSRLRLDCVDYDTEAIYTCVAESQTERLVSSTYVHIEGFSTENETLCDATRHFAKTGLLGARIFMWSGTYVEEQGREAVLVCRAAGNPRPTITWMNGEGNRITDSTKHKLLPTGDLQILDLAWEDMGGYTCIAENSYGRDESLTFLYPVKPES